MRLPNTHTHTHTHERSLREGGQRFALISSPAFISKDWRQVGREVTLYG